jgi:hypothetical protein
MSAAPTELGAPREVDPELSPSVRAVLERVLEAILEQAPSVAAPILERAHARGAISRAELYAVLARIAGAADRETRDGARISPQLIPRTELLLADCLAAIRREAPSIAAPIVADALASERLTPAQARRILARLRELEPARRTPLTAARGASVSLVR